MGTDRGQVGQRYIGGAWSNNMINNPTKAKGIATTVPAVPIQAPVRRIFLASDA